MAPLALPPGPYLERLWANGVASYTDGFNFHYYGYAEDFTGVYRQFEDAVAGLSASGEPEGRRDGGPDDGGPDDGGRMTEAGGRRTGGPEDGGADVGPTDGRALSNTPTGGRAYTEQPEAGGPKKELPVFITEYGYGLLDAESRDTVVGRVRQWRWFADVVRQVRVLRPEGPMAFLWNPYYEANLNEFGLMQVTPAKLVPDGLATKGTRGHKSSDVGGPEDGGRRAEDWPQKAQEGTKADRSTGGADGLATKGTRGHKGSDIGGPESLPTKHTEDTKVGGADVGSTGGRALLNTPTSGRGYTEQPETGRQVSFSSADFGAKRARRWMGRIGQRVGDWYASPALAYLWDFAERNPYLPRAWSVKAAPASPVVIDLIAGQDLTQVKSSGGYILGGASVAWTPVPVSTGHARLVVYNFGAEPVSGRLEIAEPSPGQAMKDEVLTLAPGERRELPVELVVSAKRWAAQMLRVRFVPDAGTVAPAVFSSALYPATYGMRPERVAGFDFKENAKRRAVLAARPVATGEPRLQPAGRWLVTEGVRVEEMADGVWRFYVDYLPAEPLRPAMVELPLPADFKFGPGTLLRLERRLGRGAEAGGAEGLKDGGSEGGGRRADVGPTGGRALSNTPTSGRGYIEQAEPEDRSDGGPEAGGAETESYGRTRTSKRTRTMGEGRAGLQVSGLRSHVSPPSPAQLKPRAGKAGDMMDVYFRTENGNLYQTWPRLRVTSDWTRYLESADNFTMGFFGRASLPWRFSENKPASLVFFLRPSQLPVVFEVRNAEIVRLEAE